MRKFKVRLQGDNGKVTITAWAKDESMARAYVTIAENCPPSAILSVTEFTPTPAELKYNILQAGTAPYFFDRKTMKFFGDTMGNFGVRHAMVKTNYDAAGNYNPDNGLTVACWELYRRRTVKYGLNSSHYFSTETLEEVFPAR
jgi:hypothetical protein